MHKKSSIRTSLGRVRGLGSAKSGTEHFWHERLSGLALLPLSIAFVIILLKVQGDSHADVVATLSHPLVIMLMSAMLLVSIWHMKLGMQVIIEDYIHTEGMKIALLVANSFFSVALGLAAVVALLKIGFGG